MASDREMNLKTAIFLGLLLALVGPQPEAWLQRVEARWRNDRAYDACMAQAGQDDWQCELILERWPDSRPQGRPR